MPINYQWIKLISIIIEQNLSNEHYDYQFFFLQCINNVYNNMLYINV